MNRYFASPSPCPPIKFTFKTLTAGVPEPLVNFNNNNDSKPARGRSRSRVHDRPLYVDLAYVPETSAEKLGDYSNLVRAKTYVMSSEMANREVFSKIVYGIRKWTNPEVETTVVSLGNESDADQWLVYITSCF